MRLDIQGANGITPTRPSASTQSQSTSSSSGSKLFTGGASSSLSEQGQGDEIEVHSLLILDQHTFEGRTLMDNFVLWNFEVCCKKRSMSNMAVATQRTILLFVIVKNLRS